MEPKQRGEYIRQQRELRNWTQVDLSEATGLSVDVISRVELGKGSIGDNALRKIANALAIVIPRENIIPDLEKPK